MDKTGIVKLAVDLENGVQNFNIDGETYSARDAEESLREALKAANGGSTVFNYKSLRRNKAEIFEIIESLVDVIIDKAYGENSFFNNCVDWVNIKKGDKNEFVVPADSDFVVCDVADGVNTPRRQRLDGGVVGVDTRIHTVRMYDEFSRFLAGRIDWSALCQKVANAFLRDTWEAIYTVLEGVTTNTRGMNATYVKTGSYTENTLLELCAHVEAETGEAPVIVGTAAALRACTTAVVSDEAKSDLYNGGYYGKFNGYEMVKIPQFHKTGTDTFALNDKIIHVFAGGQKFIKFVEAGETYILEKDNTVNADRTIEYLMEREYGVGIVVANHAYGKYTIS